MAHLAGLRLLPSETKNPLEFPLWPAKWHRAQYGKGADMFADLLFYLIIGLSFAVVVILMLGLGSFAKGGEEASQRANKMMRYRLIAQGAAVALIALFVFIFGQGSPS
jgi:hypothetical protein